MFVFSGKSACKGIAMGSVLVWKKEESPVPFIKIEDAEYEMQRVNQAVEVSKRQLQEIYEKALGQVGEEKASIFTVYRMLLEDKGFLKSIFRVIQEEKATAEYAVEVTKEKYVSVFDGMTDEYMKTRAEDIKDISRCLIWNLKNCGEVIERAGNVIDGECENDRISAGNVIHEKIVNFDRANKGHTDRACTKKFILITDELTPAEMIQIDKSKILAFVTVHGSINSHTAILARTMNIPALIGAPVEPEKIENGMQAIVDGFSGKVILEPTEEICMETVQKIRREKEKKELFQNLKGKENVTRDGRKIHIYANIGSVEDLESVLENDADGIGLFRSECLYLDRKDFPSEEEQVLVYKRVLQAMDGKKVIIRTMDIGADKQVEYFNLGKEENPALGYRAIRICLKEPEIFKTQLRALFRAAMFGNLSIIYPMITSAEEIVQIHRIVEEIKTELEQNDIPHKIPEQGIMIETPAAVMISDELAEMVDFFSIGTNDLTQYTLAVDRQNEKLDELYNPHHKAVMKMIRMVVDNAHKAGKQVGICGEVGSDTALIEEFVRMGVDELSVEPSMVLEIRKIVREI